MDCGPVWLATITSAVPMFKPEMLFAIDINHSRLNIAQEIGAPHVVNNENNTAVGQLLAITNSLGVDLVIECIGLPIE